MKTLELRIRRQNETALQIAQMLEAHSSVERVFYPGLESHSGHTIARRQMKGFGGVLSFALKSDFGTTKCFLNSLQLAHRAASLGSVNTLAGPPAATSQSSVRPTSDVNLAFRRR